MTSYQSIGFVSGSDLHRFNLLNRIERVVFPDRSGLKSLRDHPKEPQCLFNRLFLIRRADQHLCALGLRFVVAFALDNPMLSFHLRDVQRRDVQAGLFLHARLNLAIGRLAFGFCDVHFININSNPDNIDMYPQYWTPGIGGIFMRYSYEYKKMCVELYRQGKWVETPEGVKEKNFRNMIQIWARTEESCGVEALRHKNQNKVWTAEEKYELVAKVLAGESNRTTAIAAGIDKGLLYSWVRCYKMKGYQGLVAQRQGRPPKEPDMRKKIEPAELTPSEREEMIRLRAENERLRAEIAVVKKEIALREERCAAQLKAKKLRSSKSSTKKDIN